LGVSGACDDAVARRIDGNADGDYGHTETLANHWRTTGEPLANPDGTWFCLTDVQLRLAAMLTETGVLAERVAYDAYGRARHRWHSDLDGDSDVEDFNAQYAAQGTIIHNSGHRPDADHDRDGDVDGTDSFAFLGGVNLAALPLGLISDPLGPDNPIGYDGCVFAPEAGIVVGSGGTQPQAAGAYCVRFRWYLPETGRWLRRDPAGYVDSTSLYAAMRSNPASSLDPFGLWQYRWRGTWTWKEKAAVRLIIDYAVERVHRLQKQIADFQGQESACVLGIIGADLAELNRRLQAIVSGLNLPISGGRCQCISVGSPRTVRG